MKKSPVAVIKERFGQDHKAAKAKLVEAVRQAAGDLWVDRGSESKGLERVSTRKLLRLEQVFQTVSKEVGSRTKLIDQLLELQDKSKDADLRASMENDSTSRLWDRFQSVSKLARRAQKPNKA